MPGLTTVQIKHSTTTLTPPSLAEGELAYSELSQNFFIGIAGSGITCIAGPGTYATLISPAFTGTPTAPTPVSTDSSTNLATTAFVKAQSYLTGNQSLTLSGDVTGTGTTAITTAIDGAVWAKLASPTFTGMPAAPTPLTGDSSTAIATTAFVKAQSYISGNQSITLTGDVTGSGTTAITAAINGLVWAKLAGPSFTGNPTAPTPSSSDNSTSIATTAFVKAQSYLTGNQTITLSGKVSGTGTTSISTTVNLSSSDIPQTLTSAWITDFAAAVEAIPINSLTVPTGAVSFNNQNLTNCGEITATGLTGLAAPVNPSDAATKSYVDSTAQGLNVKSACACATTANITLSGLQAIDTSYTTVAGDRVLVKNQTTSTQNGIYTAAVGAWTRTADFTTGTGAPGDFVFIENGTTEGGSSWVCNNTGPITFGTSAISFGQFGAAGSYSAAAAGGLSLSGNQFSIVNTGGVTGTTGTIVVSSSGTDLSTSYPGQTSITTLGTVVTGTIQCGTF